MNPSDNNVVVNNHISASFAPDEMQAHYMNSNASFIIGGNVKVPVKINLDKNLNLSSAMPADLTRPIQSQSVS